MSVCHVCFMERSAAGVCDCESSTISVKVSEAAIAPAPMAVNPDQAMTLTEVMRVARELLDEHNLQYVKLEWMNTTRRLGEMRYRPMVGPHTIKFSRKMFPLMSRSEQMNTITHEVAHALTWGLDHGPAWRRKHIELGGNGRRCSDLDETVMEAAAKWVGTCPNGHKGYRQRETPKMYQVSCSKCSRTWNPNYKFTWVKQS